LILLCAPFHVHITAATSSLVVHYGIDQAFAGTGTWDAWDTVTVPITLAAGDHTISVIYNSSQGSLNRGERRHPATMIGLLACPGGRSQRCRQQASDSPLFWSTTAIRRIGSPR
jgi:hypothetical protein